MLGTDTAVEIQTHTTAKRPTERNSVGDTSPFVHLYEIVLRRASTWPTAIAIGGQEGLTWKTLNGRQLLELVDLLAQELAGEGGNKNAVHRAGQSVGERLRRELQREAAR